MNGCSVCGNQYRVGHICSLADDKIVCEECCSGCTFRTAWRCSHSSEQAQIENEIEKLKRRIEFLEKKAFYAYDKGWVNTADNYVWEAKEAMRQKRALEEKRNENRKQGI